MLTTASTHTELADALTGGVVLPGDPGWDEARAGFNLFEDQHPAAVAYPVDATDVAAAVTYARRAGLRVAPQATGHNQGPLGDMEDVLLLNVSALQEVRVDPGARQVRVGAGVKWDRVAPRLSAHGLAGLHGSSPDVGIAGYSLGGGMGWLARKYGLQTNAVTALELVTAEGTLVRADHDHHADLFWALRGGGGNFGVVTAIEFAVHTVDELYAGALFFPFERASEVLHTWGGLVAGELPDEFMSWASLLHFPPIPDVPAFARGRSFVIVMAAFLGSEGEGREILRSLRDLGPERDTFATVPPVVLGDLAMDPLDPLPMHSGHQLVDELPPDVIEAILAAVGPGSDRGTALTMLQFRQMGGALAREAPGAGARATLPGAFSMFALGVVDEASHAVVRAAVDDVEAVLLPHRAGHYPNFIERPADASSFFSAETWARLRDVKARYDAGDLFAGNHHIPPTT